MLKTPLYASHQRLGAKLIDFGGWEMPLLYRGITEEHIHTRAASSVFDVSHMGRLFFSGKDALSFLQRICTRNLSLLKPGRSGYSHVCHESGGILDDVIVSRFEDKWLMVCNAGNREKMLAHLKQHAEGYLVQIDDTTFDSVMLAIQGPATMDLFKKHLPIKVEDMGRYGFSTGSYMGQKYQVFRSGYTGEDGLEVVVGAGVGVLLWDFLTQRGGEDRVTVCPAGLGARDTLRLEAGMPLYGHELSEQVDPLSAGCGWCVDLTQDFIGAEALRIIDAEGPRRKITGLMLEGKRIARQGSKVYQKDQEIGEITSGTLSPTLDKSIAQAFVETSVVAAGETVFVDIRGTLVNATVVPLPFYKRNY